MTAVDGELDRAKREIAELTDKVSSLESEVTGLIMSGCDEPRDHDNLAVLLEAVRTDHDTNHAEPWTICPSQVCRLANRLKR